MKRYGKKVRFNAKTGPAVVVVLFLVFLGSQATNYFSFWIWGPNTGHRLAGLSSGHFERRYPGLEIGAPTIGVVMMSAGERLTVDYDLTIHEGKISFAIWKLPVVSHRPRDLGPRLIKASGSGRLEFTAKSWGFYRVYLHAHRWQGDIAVDWRTDAPALQRAQAAGT